MRLPIGILAALGPRDYLAWETLAPFLYTFVSSFDTNPASSTESAPGSFDLAGNLVRCRPGRLVA